MSYLRVVVQVANTKCALYYSTTAPPPLPPPAIKSEKAIFSIKVTFLPAIWRSMQQKAMSNMNHLYLMVKKLQPRLKLTTDKQTPNQEAQGPNTVHLSTIKPLEDIIHLTWQPLTIHNLISSMLLHLTIKRSQLRTFTLNMNIHNSSASICWLTISMQHFWP